ncbi:MULTISPECIES: TadE family protein [unclassified Massilia]|uniref:TadE family protein n=1 Tax=unclassified Massilia TaxID=2609279 RepID=UPI0017827204|nr:pilus assembly protein [Massilia sp. CFBP 13647]MBD8672765.1 pilus assembly protein [Massilia sp. CFBP 13721]
MAVEFSLVALIFLTVVFATLELARMEFLLNTLEEVTRRAAAAAANVDYRDSTAIEKVQANAIFRNSPGPLALGDPVIANHVKIDYLSVSNTTWDLTHMSTLPTCPAANRSNCMTNPHGGNCIRFVRARVCASMDDAGSCYPVSYQMVFPFLNLSGMKLPSAETIVPAGSLGATAGSIPCP